MIVDEKVDIRLCLTNTKRTYNVVDGVKYALSAENCWGENGRYPQDPAKDGVNGIGTGEPWFFFILPVVPTRNIEGNVDHADNRAEKDGEE